MKSYVMCLVPLNRRHCFDCCCCNCLFLSCAIHSIEKKYKFFVETYSCTIDPSKYETRTHKFTIYLCFSHVRHIYQDSHIKRMTIALDFNNIKQFINMNVQCNNNKICEMWIAMNCIWRNAPKMFDNDKTIPKG